MAKRTVELHEKTELFRHNLRVLLAGYGNVTKAAKAAGLSREYLSSVIHGDHVLNLDAAFRLADHVGYSMEFLTSERLEAKQPAIAS